MKHATNRVGLLTAALLLCISVASAQVVAVDELLEKANKQYNLYAYNLAVRSYRSVLEQEPGNPEAIGKLADCYRQLNQPDEAVKWYERAVIIPGASAGTVLNFGKTLMSLGRYDEARVQFVRFQQSDAATGQHFVSACDFAKAHADDAANFDVKNEAVNTPSSDFGAAFFNKNVVFSSSRSDLARKTDKKSASDWTGDAFNQLFVSSRDAKGFLGKPSFLKSDLENNFNEGPVSFSADGERLAFSRNNFVDGSRQIGSGVRMSLYTGELIDGKWANVKPFPHNGDFSTGYATFSPDSRVLYFASDREGGYGGWDIYASNFNGKSWDAPANLGPSVNTPGDEITPFYDGKSLFFASDWLEGFGGMDVFRADVDGGEFKKITHLGPGINSSRDDYGFTYDAAMNLGYLTSNRKGGKGNEDIWQVSRATEVFSITVNSDKKPLAACEFDFAACNGGKATGDANGSIQFDLLEGTNSCTVVVRKAGFEAVAVEVYSGMKERNLLVNLQKREVGTPASVEMTPPASPVTYSTETPGVPVKGSSKNFDGQWTGRVMNADTKGYLEDVFVGVKSAEGKMLGSVQTDAEGRFGFDFEPGKTYKVTASRAGFAEESLTVKADATKKDLGEIKLRDAYSAAAAVPAKQPEPPVAAAPKPAETKPAETKPAEQKKEEPAPVVYSTEKKTEAKPETAKPEVVVFKPDSNGASAPKPVVFSTQKEEVAAAGYSVQIAMIDGKVDQPFLKKYSTLADMGNVYATPDGKVSKIRLGIYANRAKADSVVLQSKRLGYKGAFVVPEKERSEALAYPGKAAAKPAAIAAPKPVEHSTVAAKAPEKEAEPPIIIIANKKEEVPVVAAKPEVKPEPKAADAPKRWCVQIAALTNGGEAVDMSAYAPLFEVGNVYTIPEKATTKIRVGVWDNKAEAEKAETDIKKKGFNDALAIEEKAIYRREKLVNKPTPV